MHELSIAVSLIEAAQEEAERLGSPEIAAVHLRLGPLSGVVKEALLFSYELAAGGTPLEGSKLVIEEAPVLVFCAQCKQRRPIQSLQCFRCSTCDTPSSEVVQGRELEVIGLEIRE